MRASDWFLRFGIGTLAACLCATPAFAQETVTPSATTPDESADSNSNGDSYSLTGTVINDVTGEPVRRAAVQVSGHAGTMALTDAGGRFVLEGLAEGDVFLTALKPGFYDDETSHTAPVRVGKDAPAVILKLTPSAVISGRVTTKDEQPLEGVHIRVLAQQNLEGRIVWADSQNLTVTDEEGEFRVAGLQAGTYYVAANQSGTTPSQKGVVNAREQVFASVFYSGVSDMSSATAIEIAPGQEVEANFTLSAEPVYQVSGSLTGAVNVASGLVFARKAGEDIDFTETANFQDGKFQAKLPAGAYSVGGTTSDGVELTTRGATVVIRSDDAALRVPLSAAVTIPVEIEKEQDARGSERKAPGQGFPDGFLRLDPVSQFEHRASFWNAQAGGIRNVAPGTYRLQFTTIGEWWVKSAQSGGVDLLSDDLTVGEGEKPQPINVTLRDGAGTVLGTVTPAGDPGRSLVLLVQQHGTRNIIHAARAMRGNFTIPGVPPGDYAILALDGGDRLEYANPEVLDPYLSDADHVTVRAHGTVTVNLGLTSVKR